MRASLRAHQALETDLERLRRDKLLVIELDHPDDLVVAPTLDPYVASRSPERAGVEELAATLAAARRLPETRTVRVVLPLDATLDRSTADLEGALRRRAGSLSAAAWREGMAIRSMGLRQLPAGAVIAVASWVVAAVAASLAVDAADLERVLLALVSMLGITIAWVVSWMVIEFIMVDWRLAARRADAYDLLAGARLEVVVEGPAGG